MSVWLIALIVYLIIGVGLAGLWRQITASMPMTRWQGLAGIAFYFSVWPAMIAIDLIEALKIERKFRAARRRGEL